MLLKHGNAWKGGRSAQGNGYIRVWRPGHPLASKLGHVLEHRLVLYESGIDPCGHHVHHINGDKSDNRLENLKLVGAAKHLSDHVQAAGVVVNQYGAWPVTGLPRLEAIQQWRVANPEKVRSYKRKWQQENRGYINACRRRKRRERALE